MALIRRRAAVVLDAARASAIAAGTTVVLAAAMAAGCSAAPAAGPVAKGHTRTTLPPSVTSAPVPAKAQAPKVQEVAKSAPSRDWESFSNTGAALRADIAARADDMKKGPIGNRGAELASLRLAAAGRELIDAGSPGGALEALQRALSLYGGNGYAYLYLAYVNHVQGRDERAAEFAANARRYLPSDKAVQAELEGLTIAIRESAATAGT